MLDTLAQFHLLRPWWLLTIPAALPLLWLATNKTRPGSWSKVIDPRWLPFMLESTAHRHRKQWPWFLTTGIAALALSGPSWQQLPQPLHKDQSALVILLDLSPSMNAADLKPNRITRARYKLQDILQQRTEGQTALLVYSGSAHIVTPLTDDTATIGSQLEVLSPELITNRGSNTEAAVDLAIQMLDNGGHSSGDILLITDGVANVAEKYIRKQLHGTALRLSVLGVGTDNGAPVAMENGGFAKDRNGNIVVPKLERKSLIKLARRNGGQYTDLTPDNRDLQILTNVFSSDQIQQSKQLDRTFDYWHDQGYWLVLLLIPLVIVTFRKGLVACLLLAPLLSAFVAEPVQAAKNQPQPVVNHLPNFLQSNDQQGQRAFQNQQFEKASKVFKDSRWKGSAAYRNGDFEAALQEFQKDDSATGLYNQGNALAQLGELDKAIDAYARALEKDPAQEDAASNKKLLEELKKQQQNQDGDQQKNQKDDQQQDSQDQQSQQDSQQDGAQSSDQETADQQQSEQQEQALNQTDSEQTGSEQKNSDRENAEQHDDKAQDQKEARDKQQAAEKDNPQQPEGKPQNAQRDNAAKEEAEQAMEQYLRKVPNNPGAFLREKFRRQQQQQQRQRQEQPERW